MIDWVELCRFTVPGQPVAKARPKFVRTPTGGRAIPGKRSKAFEARVAVCVQTTRRRWGRIPVAPKGVPIRVDIVAIFKRPNSQQGSKHPPGLLPRGKRPDLDNVIKSTLDGINRSGVIWDDDAQVQCIRAEQYYAEKEQPARTEVVIYLPKSQTQNGL